MDAEAICTVHTTIPNAVQAKHVGWSNKTHMYMLLFASRDLKLSGWWRRSDS